MPVNICISYLHALLLMALYFTNQQYGEIHDFIFTKLTRLLLEVPTRQDVGITFYFHAKVSCNLRKLCSMNNRTSSFSICSLIHDSCICTGIYIIQLLCVTMNIISCYVDVTHCFHVIA